MLLLVRGNALWTGVLTSDLLAEAGVLPGADAVLRKLIPGCQGQPHTTIENGGHFLQEDQGEALARVLTDLARDA